MTKNKAAFFDRDGTLIKDANYLSRLDKIEILPGAFEICRFLQNSGLKLFVVTNQSGIARGFFDEEFVKKTHVHLENIFLEQEITFKKFYYCPHHPLKSEELKYLKNCFCRKPNPGMLLQAAQEFDIDLTKSLMFGDKLKDVHAGLNVGCKSFNINNFLGCDDYEIKLQKIIDNL